MDLDLNTVNILPVYLKYALDNHQTNTGCWIKCSWI